MRIPEWERPGRTVIADARGEFRVELPPHPSVSPHASQPIRAEARATAAGMIFGSSARRVPPGRRVELDPVLGPGPQWSGRILDPSGQPVRAAAVELVHDGGVLATANTWADGRFFFLPRDAGSLELRASHSQAGCLRPSTFDPPSGRSVDLGDLVLEPGGTLEGRMTTPDGRPLPGVGLFARLQDESPAEIGTWGSRQARTRTSSDGTFALRGLVPGRYRLDPIGLSAAQAKPARVVETGGFEPWVETRRLLRVRVEDTSGRALPGATVVIDGRAADGAYQTATSDLDLDSTAHEWVDAGRWTVVAGSPGAVPFAAAVDVLADDPLTEVVAVLDFGQRPGRLALQLTGPDDEPLEPWSAQLTPAVEGLGEAGFVLHADSRDTKDLELPPGLYRVRAWAGSRLDGTYFPVQGSVRVRPGEPAHLALQPQPGARLRLSLDLSAFGAAPPRGIDLSLSDAAGRRHGLAFVRSTKLGPAEEPHPLRGAPVSGLLAPGKYRLHAGGEGIEEAHRSLELEPAAIADLELALRPRP